MNSCVTTWDDNDYVTEVEKELSNTDINKQVTFKEKLCVSQQKYQVLPWSKVRRSYFRQKNEIILFMYESKKSNSGKLFPLTKIHKILYNLPGSSTHGNSFRVSRPSS